MYLPIFSVMPSLLRCSLVPWHGEVLFLSSDLFILFLPSRVLKRDCFAVLLGSSEKTEESL